MTEAQRAALYGTLGLPAPTPAGGLLSEAAAHLDALAPDPVQLAQDALARNRAARIGLDGEAADAAQADAALDDLEVRYETAQARLRLAILAARSMVEDALAAC